MEPPHTEGGPLWLTAYLFFEGHPYGEAADRVIREVVAPLARACRPDAVRWFFLRYAEETSHVRLRFLAPGPVLEETIWPRVAEAASSSELVMRSTRERYEPEVERYGGPWGLALQLPPVCQPLCGPSPSKWPLLGRASSTQLASTRRSRITLRTLSVMEPA